MRISDWSSDVCSSDLWSHKDYPLIKVGTMTLNRNPENFFAQIEQAAFSPGNTVPGIGLSPDKMLLGRAFAYADAQRNRIGKIGRASCREGVCQYVYISVVAAL